MITRHPEKTGPTGSNRHFIFTPPRKGGKNDLQLSNLQPSTTNLRIPFHLDGTPS